MVGWISTAATRVDASWDAWSRFHQAPHLEGIRATDAILPITVGYETPETLGADRLAAAIGACSYFPGRPVLVIDAGTAITYDVVDASGTYLGGAISPGLHMRFNTLHTFTARLPLVDLAEQAPTLGVSTFSSIQTGVQQGAIQEMRGFVDLYKEKLGQALAVFITGGDAHVFEKHVKKANFARFHLLLEGIFLTLKHRISSI